ncbi:zf-HC2 domain-containing protein [bacterium]|nr:zf-HC2 domain-containing protein [bacterium]
MVQEGKYIYGVIREGEEKEFGPIGIGDREDKVYPVRNKPPRGGCRRALRAGRISNGVEGKMISCRKVKRWMIDYLEGTLSKKKKVLFKKHLSKCSRCAQEVEALVKTQRLVRLKAREEMPEGFWAHYLPRLKRRSFSLKSICQNVLGVPRR